MEELIKLIEAPHVKENLPDFKAGDTVNVHVLIKEGEKERVQQYQGVCLQRRGGEALRATFTVRKVSNGKGVERIFHLHSPAIAKIDVLRRGIVRRAKLFYLRELSGKSARIKERR